MADTVKAKSTHGNDVGEVQVSTVVHSKGYTYTQYGDLAPHQVSKGKGKGKGK